MGSSLQLEPACGFSLKTDILLINLLQILRKPVFPELIPLLTWFLLSQACRTLFSDLFLFFSAIVLSWKGLSGYGLYTYKSKFISPLRVQVCNLNPIVYQRITPVNSNRRMNQTGGFKLQTWTRVGFHNEPSSTILISSSVNPYNSYTNWSIWRSVASIWRWITVLSRAVFADANCQRRVQVCNLNPYSESA